MIVTAAFIAAPACITTAPSGQVVESQPPPARLASTDAEPISLFGDLPEHSLDEYRSAPGIALRQHTFTEEGAESDPDMDPTGRFVLYASTRHSLHPDLYLQATDGVAVTQLTSDPASDVQPALSPDGKRIAFASDRTGDWDIWVINIDGTQAVQVTSGPGDDVHPSWSADGQRLVYSTLPPGVGQWELWIAGAVAGGARQFIGHGLFPEWSPAGDTILFQRARERGSRWFSIWTLTLVEGEPRYPTEIAASSKFAMIAPTWSTDGTAIAFTSVGAAAFDGVSAPGDEEAQPATSAVSDVWVVQLDGRGRRQMTDGRGTNQSPVFGSDGRLYFVSDRAGTPNVWSLPLTASPAGDSARLTAFGEDEHVEKGEVIEASHHGSAPSSSGAHGE